MAKMPRLSVRNSRAQAVLDHAQELRNLAANALEGRGFMDLEILAGPMAAMFVPAVCVLDPMDLIDDAQALEDAVAKARELLTRNPE